MDPNKPPFQLRLPGVRHVPVARGRGLYTDEPLLGRARGLGVTAEELSVGQARGLAVASEEPLLGRARGLALITDEPLFRQARGLSMTVDEPSVGRARGPPVAPAELIAGRGRGLVSTALDAPLFPYGRGSPGFSSDKPVSVTRGKEEEEEEYDNGGGGFGRSGGLLHPSQEPTVGKGRSMSLFVKESEPPGQSERVDTSEAIPGLQEEVRPNVQVRMKVCVFLGAQFFARI